MDDGAERVQLGDGTPKLEDLPAEVVHIDSHTRRARLVLPEYAGAVTVVYSNATGARSQALLATSRLVFGQAASLGAMPEAWRPQDGSCALQGRALVWTPKTTLEAPVTGL